VIIISKIDYALKLGYNWSMKQTFSILIERPNWNALFSHLCLIPLLFSTSLFAQPITGLSFPSNGDSPSTAFVAFQFVNPQNSGMPIWGADGGGTTFIWKYKPRQQPGYYVTFWWSNNGGFLWDSGSPNSYYGAHPYPRGGGTTTTIHDWEIATDWGGDYVKTRSESPKVLVTEIWYTQALRVTRNANGTKTLIFYTALPSVANTDIIEFTNSASYGEKNPSEPAITFGDSPWYAQFQHERLSGILRGIKIFNKVLSQNDLLTEAASDSVITEAGKANIWYLNSNPTPSDIEDHSGKAHHFRWAQPNFTATLWTGTDIIDTSKPTTIFPPSLKGIINHITPKNVTVLGCVQVQKGSRFPIFPWK
jgi:hypothetical protein